MRTIKQKVYKFNELKPEIQEKVIEKFIEQGTFYWNEDLDEILRDLTKEIKEKTGLEIYKDNIYYDLNRRECDIYIPSSYILSALREKYDIVDIDLPRNFDTYTEFNENDIYFEEGLEDLKEIEEQKLIIIDLKIIQEILEEGFKRLLNESDYMNSRDYIEEEIKINDYEFFEDGELYYKRGEYE